MFFTEMSVLEKKNSPVSWPNVGLCMLRKIKRYMKLIRSIYRDILFEAV